MRAALAAVCLAFLMLAGCTGTPPTASLLGTTATQAATDGRGASTGPAAPSSVPPMARCSGSGSVPLTTSPMAPADFATLLPYGLVVGGHVTPIDHMYFFPADWPGHRDEYEVRAIANGSIVDMQTRPSQQPPGSQPGDVEYNIQFDHTCTFHSYFDLVTSVSPRLLEWYHNVTRPGSDVGPLPVTAGEVIGHIGGQTLDFGVYDDELTLPGFAVPAHYPHESFKLHTADPFPFFTEPVRSQLLAKDVRNAEPRAGRIDYDQDGRASGTWFRDGSVDYAGNVPPGSPGYWSGHLALVPDAILPDHLIVSLGEWAGGDAHQFAVQGNAPAFDALDAAAGPAKYELVDWDYTDLDHPEDGSFHSFPHPMPHPAWRNGDSVHGTLLVQVTGPQTLRVEQFPGKAASQVLGFDDAAQVYRR